MADTKTLVEDAFRSHAAFAGRITLQYLPIAAFQKDGQWWLRACPTQDTVRDFLVDVGMLGFQFREVGPRW